MANDDRAEDILLRIEQLLKGLLRTAVADKVSAIRTDYALRSVYEMTGSSATVAEISKKTKMSTGKISGIWQTWEEEGLIVKIGKSYRKLVD
jgi:hypothetical protein